MPPPAHDSSDAVPSVPVPEQIVLALRDVLSEAFGLPGNGNVHFIDALLRHGVPIVTTRHEAGTVAAADVYHRVSGRLGLATATYGAGVTNLVSALAEAVRAGTPMLVVVGTAPTTGPMPWDVDQTALAASVGAPTYVVTADDAPDIARRAANHAIVERLPVVISIPADLAVASTPMPESTVDLVLEAPHRGVPDPDRIAEAARLLHGARYPLIVAGRGAAGPGIAEDLTRLADALGAGRLVTVGVRGLFGAESAHLGVTGGFAPDEVADAAERADVVLVVGSGLNQFATRFGHMFSPQARLIRIDVLEDPPGPAAHVGIRGDAALAVPALLTETRRLGPGGAAWGGELDALARAQSDRPVGEDVAPDGRLDPRRVAALLDGMLPRDRVVVQDVGHFVGWPNTYWAFSDPSQMIMIGAAMQAVGLGFHGAAGAARARPDAFVVVSVGDGGALMALADLDTIFRTLRRGLVIVWNDASYAAEVHQYVPIGLDGSTLAVEDRDFAGMARALGGRGITVDRVEALEEARAWLAADEDGVLLIDCKISGEIVAPYFQEIVDMGH